MIILVVLVAVTGFVAGFLTFKRSNRWCPRCGGTLRCEACRHTAMTRRA